MIATATDLSADQEMEASAVTECAKDFVCAQGKEEREQTIAVLIDEIKRMEKVEKGKSSPSQKDSALEPTPVAASSVAVESEYSLRKYSYFYMNFISDFSAKW